MKTESMPKRRISDTSYDETFILQAMSDEGGKGTINHLRKQLMLVDRKLDYPKADSRVRNALRRLRGAGIVKRTDPGSYLFPMPKGKGA